MKRYVTELANDILKHNEENKLMRQEIKARQKQTIENILDDCRNGFITDTEAVYLIARMRVN